MTVWCPIQLRKLYANENGPYEHYSHWMDTFPHVVSCFHNAWTSVTIFYALTFVWREMFNSEFICATDNKIHEIWNFSGSLSDSTDPQSINYLKDWTMCARGDDDLRSKNFFPTKLQDEQFLACFSLTSLSLGFMDTRLSIFTLAGPFIRKKSRKVCFYLAFKMLRKCIRAVS